MKTAGRDGFLTGNSLLIRPECALMKVKLDGFCFTNGNGNGSIDRGVNRPRGFLVLSSFKFCQIKFYLRRVFVTSYPGSSPSRGRKGEDTGNKVQISRILYEFAHFCEKYWIPTSRLFNPGFLTYKKKNNYSRVHLTLQLCSLTKLLAFPRQPRERKGLQDLLAAS